MSRPEKTSGLRKSTLILLLAICILPAWAYFEMQSQRQAAIESSKQLKECKKLAQTIKQLRDKPLQASTNLRSVAKLARSIEESAEKAQIPLQQVVQIAPKKAQRIEKTLYKEQRTQVELSNITLRQVITLAHIVSTEDPGTCITEIRLHAPRINSEKNSKIEVWDAEVALTSLLFVP